MNEWFIILLVYWPVIALAIATVIGLIAFLIWKRIIKGSTVFLVMLGLVIACVGGLFVALMGMSYMRAVEQREWPQVDAVVLSSEVEEYKHDDYSPMQYRMKILYGYEWNGETKTGDRYGVRKNPRYNDREKVASLLENYPIGKRTKVYVNPADGNSILKPDSKAAGYSIWFPMLFVIGGLGIAIRAIVQCFTRRSHP